MRDFKRPEMSIEECRKFLSKNGEEYTDEEITEIRNFLLNLLEIECKIYRMPEKKEEEKK